jgi:Predicted AAA-ATPase/PD-(D/E)XK nuclease superfamily
MQLPIGYSDFAEIVRSGLDFVDKSLFIQEILDNPAAQVILIPRPRRFGKTLNLSMLHCFLAAQVNRQPTQNLFHGLKIAQLGKEYARHQGQYPVIFISFKDIKDKKYEEVYGALQNLISQVYQEHYYLLESPHLNPSEQAVFRRIVEKQAPDNEFSTSLQSLTHFLYKHFNVKPWLLIDEYDTPIQSGYLWGYYDNIIQLMRKLFGSALKDNHSLKKAVITGILRISKESLFSGINNLKVHSIFNTGYHLHFGFTEEEVVQLLEKAGLTACGAAIREWYNGYQIGGTVIYNPWSLVNCIDEKGALRPYWVNTSSNDLIRHLLARSDDQIKMDLESIIRGESITALIDENMVFDDLEKNRSAIWSLLLFSGYFKIMHAELKESQLQCELMIPNREIMSLYRDVIRGWLGQAIGYEQYLAFLTSLTEGRVEEFSHRLQKYLVETFSIFDAAEKNPEKFYHGFVLGLMVSLSETHEVRSNRESGYGRYDVMLIPKDIEQLGILLEFKTVLDESTSLPTAAEQALQQIDQRHYAVELQSRGLQRILKIGLAFRGKKVHVLSAHEFAYAEPPILP